MRLETKRTILREFETYDVFAINEYGRDERVYHFSDWGPNTPKISGEFVNTNIEDQKKNPRTDFELIVESKSTGDFMGICGIHISNEGSKEGWIGYGFKQEFWGKGYGLEVAKAIVAFGFEDLRLHRIYATCHVDNLRSENILKKLGMTLKEVKLKDTWCRTYWRDTKYYDILEKDHRGNTCE